MNTEQLFEFAKVNKIETVDIKFANLFGGLHHLTLPIDRLNDSLFVRGLGIDASSIPGFKRAGSSDALLIPDPSTAVVDPFWDSRTLSLFGSVFDTADRKPLSFDTRQTALRAEQYLSASGIASHSLWGPELEFYIFDSIAFTNEINLSFYEVQSGEADWSRCDRCSRNTAYPIPRQGGYHAAPPQDKYYNLRNKMSEVVKTLGIRVKYHHHEVGGPGQAEIETEMAPLVASGDAAMLIKYVCKMVALREGQCVTFMPKPLYNEAGSGLHFHQQLFNGDAPLFYDEGGYSCLSKTALSYIAGLLAHGPALLALTNPSTNSYKRLVPGFEAPVRAMFGAGNRAAAVRIPTYAKQPLKARIEFRPPDATCNVYLAMAAQLMAGLDGIKRDLDPVSMGFGPFESDIAAIPSEQRDLIQSLPTSLREAMLALEADSDFLFVGEVFRPELIENLIRWKLEKEYDEVRNRPHPYEMRLYFDC